MKKEQHGGSDPDPPFAPGKLLHRLVAALGLQERQQQIAVIIHRQAEAHAVALAVAEALELAEAHAPKAGVFLLRRLGDQREVLTLVEGGILQLERKLLAGNDGHMRVAGIGQKVLADHVKTEAQRVIIQLNLHRAGILEAGDKAVLARFHHRFLWRGFFRSMFAALRRALAAVLFCQQDGGRGGAGGQHAEGSDHFPFAHGHSSVCLVAFTIMLLYHGEGKL